MKPLSGVLLSLLVLASCQNGGVKGFWDSVPLLEDDVHISEERFADFSELAVASPEKDAKAALDKLFNRLSEDEVAYYVYTEWIEEAFYSILSPCRNADLFTYAARRIDVDGIVDGRTRERMLREAAWMEYNQVGFPAIIPGVATPCQRTLVLLLDPGCPSCQVALETMSANPEWTDVARIAVCRAGGLRPDVKGWEYVYLAHPEAIFDPTFTPVYFVISEDGLIEQSYTPVL